MEKCEQGHDLGIHLYIRSDGGGMRCKKCKNIARKKWRRSIGKMKNKLTDRKSKLKKYYGISLVEYQRLLEEQNNVCAICNKINADGRRLNVDHNHKTRKVRGLLCHNCNLAIGYVKEDIDILNKIIGYLNSCEKENSS